jgi:hypothetical protein
MYIERKMARNIVCKRKRERGIKESGKEKEGKREERRGKREIERVKKEREKDLIHQPAGELFRETDRPEKSLLAKREKESFL